MVLIFHDYDFGVGFGYSIVGCDQETFFVLLEIQIRQRHGKMFVVSVVVLVPVVGLGLRSFGVAFVARNVAV